MVIIGPIYMVVAVALLPHACVVSKISIEKSRRKCYRCILISSTMVLLLSVQIRILSLLCRRGFITYMVEN